MRSEPLLAWQWSQYPLAHADRRNLLIHVLTAPLFVLAPLAAVLIVALGAPWWIGALALLGMPLAVIAQGVGHRLESAPPAPFEGPLDVLARITAEQWVNFPRFVLSGGFARAWRAAR